MGLVLADDLPDGEQFVGFVEFGAEAPDDRPVAGDDGNQVSFPAADDNVVGRKPLIARVEPAAT